MNNIRIKRRDFIKTTAVGATGMALGMTPFQIRTKSDIDRLYDRSIIIDALSLGHEWNKEELDAVKLSGYTGIQTSLANTTWDSALKSIAEWNDRIDTHPDVFIKATKALHFKQAKKESKLAVMYGHQNATMIDDKVERLDILHELGTRCIQLTYNSRNLLGDGCTERTNAGLSDFGLKVVERMNDLGIIVDLSHCGKQTSYDGIKFSKRPACFTHTMCEALYPGHPRAKTDKQLRAMGLKDGMVGIAALGYFVGPDPGGETTIETYLDHIDHAVKIVGLDHVGLCTDYQIHGIEAWATKETWYEPRLKFFKPSYNVKWPPWIPELDEPQRFRNVAHGLFRRGYSERAIEKILGENWLNYFEEVLGG
tara:strand:- start:1834 stop:2934 length:1101 start_codon:yes stop_codon:yes gene_type:complete